MTPDPDSSDAADSSDSMGTHGPADTAEPRPHGRGLAWVAVVVGILLLLGVASSAVNQTTHTSGAAETAGLVVGRLVFIGLAVWAIVWGARRLRR